MIEDYVFGKITINGKDYHNDVEVDWEGTVLNWKREESHIIDIADLKRAMEKNPETIVIGTGESGVAKITKEAEIFIQESGAMLIIDKTEEAIKTFNILKEDSLEEEGRQNRVVGLFHLTC